MGRCVYNTILQSNDYGKEYQIKGFIDDNLCALDCFNGYPPVIGKIAGFEIQENDVFVNALGGIESKKQCIEKLLTQGADFINLIHPTAIINSNAKLGKGCIVDSYSVIGADTMIGDFVVISVGVVVGHDVAIGSWSRIDGHVTLVGNATIGQEVCIHTGAIINHKVQVENRSCVGAGSFVIRKVKEGTTVYGNPARRLM